MELNYLCDGRKNMKKGTKINLFAASCGILVGAVSLTSLKMEQYTPIYMYKTQEVTYSRFEDIEGEVSFRQTDSESKYLSMVEIGETPLLEIEAESGTTQVYYQALSEHPSSPCITEQMMERLVTDFKEGKLEDFLINKMVITKVDYEDIRTKTAPMREKLATDVFGIFCVFAVRGVIKLLFPIPEEKERVKVKSDKN